MSTITSTGCATTSYTTYPTAYITVSKQRLKQFGTNVYLNHGDNYEIELFNPTSCNIMAKIQIDSNFISDKGIVIKPGQRVFLERFIDTNNKFVFNTYNIDSTDQDATRAIQNNGDISVSFFNEHYDTYVWRDYWINQPHIVYTNYNTSGTFGCTGDPGPSGPIGIPGAPDTLSYTSEISANYSSKETGRTERGGRSSQQFTSTDMKFSNIPYHTVYWKILPTSAQAYVTAANVNVLYCSDCGAKRKKDSFKFCPFCGNKY